MKGAIEEGKIGKDYFCGKTLEEKKQWTSCLLVRRS